MSTMKMTCPVCGTENTRTYYSCEWGLEEDHYNCENCGFFDHMVYGSTGRGIDTLSGTSEDRARKESLVLQYNQTIKKLCLEINPESMYYL